MPSLWGVNRPKARCGVIGVDKSEMARENLEKSGGQNEISRLAHGIFHPPAGSVDNTRPVFADWGRFHVVRPVFCPTLMRF